MKDKVIAKRCNKLIRPYVLLLIFFGLSAILFTILFILRGKLNMPIGVPYVFLSVAIIAWLMAIYPLVGLIALLQLPTCIIRREGDMLIGYKLSCNLNEITGISVKQSKIVFPWRDPRKDKANYIDSWGKVTIVTTNSVWKCNFIDNVHWVEIQLKEILEEYKKEMESTT